jgi:hypothetical protein
VRESVHKQLVGSSGASLRHRVCIGHPICANPAAGTASQPSEILFLVELRR